MFLSLKKNASSHSLYPILKKCRFFARCLFRGNHFFLEIRLLAPFFSAENPSSIKLIWCGLSSLYGLRGTFDSEAKDQITLVWFKLLNFKRASGIKLTYCTLSSNPRYGYNTICFRIVFMIRPILSTGIRQKLPVSFMLLWLNMPMITLLSKPRWIIWFSCGSIPVRL